MPSRLREASKVAPTVVTVGDAALVRVVGTIDEWFPGFGDLAGMTAVVIDVSGVRFMTSFGVARWMKALAATPPSTTKYLAGCPPIFVEQLNMILNFAGSAKILSLFVPYTCARCGAEKDELLDVLAAGSQISDAALPEKPCPQCGGELVFDVINASYLGCLRTYGATDIHPAAAQLLAAD